MSVNRRRGEVAVELGGHPYRLRLTLGALAELEAAYAADDLGQLVARFTHGSLSATDIIRVLGAGLRGAGHDFTDEAVGRMDGGSAAALAEAVGALLLATFGAETSAAASPENP